MRYIKILSLFTLLIFNIGCEKEAPAKLKTTFNIIFPCQGGKTANSQVYSKVDLLQAELIDYNSGKVLSKAPTTLQKPSPNLEIKGLDLDKSLKVIIRLRGLKNDGSGAPNSFQTTYFGTSRPITLSQLYSTKELNILFGPVDQFIELTSGKWNNSQNYIQIDCDQTKNEFSSDMASAVGERYTYFFGGAKYAPSKEKKFTDFHVLTQLSNQILVFDSYWHKFVESKATLPQKRARAGSVVYKGKAYLFGGYIQNDQGLISSDNKIIEVDLSNGALNTWSSTLKEKRSDFSYQLFEGKVYIFGGKNAANYTSPTKFKALSSIEIIDLDSKSVTASTETLSVGRFFSYSSLSNNGHIVISGGSKGVSGAGGPRSCGQNFESVRNEIDIFDAQSGKIINKSKKALCLNNYRALHVSVPIGNDNDVLFLYGGRVQSGVNATAIYKDEIQDTTSLMEIYHRKFSTIKRYSKPGVLLSKRVGANFLNISKDIWLNSDPVQTQNNTTEMNNYEKWFLIGGRDSRKVSSKVEVIYLTSCNSQDGTEGCFGSRSLSIKQFSPTQTQGNGKLSFYGQNVALPNNQILNFGGFNCPDNSCNNNWTANANNSIFNLNWLPVLE